MKSAGTLSKDGHYTYADLLTWDDDVRYELIDGVAYAMTSPSTSHQRILRKLSTKIDTFLEGKPCELFISPSDVRINYDTTDDTVLQPDLYVICNKTKLHERGYLGAPDLVIEITSPTTARNDKIVKFQKYLEAGVLEYWIVETENKIINRFVLDNDSYKLKAFGDGDVIESLVLDGLSINLSEVFEI